MTELTGYSEGIDPVELERRDLAQGIAKRRIIETKLQYSHFSDVTYPEILFDATEASLATNIETFLRFPTPFAAFLDNSIMLLDQFSDGDNNHILESLTNDHPEMQGLTTVQFTRVLKITSEPLAELMHKYAQPEFKFEATMKMIENSKELATKNNTSRSEAFTNEELYRELIRTSFTKEEYSQECEQISRSITFDEFIRSTVHLALLFQQLNEDPNAEITQPSSMEISDQIFSLKNDPERLDQLKSIFQNDVVDRAKKFANYNILRFWGENKTNDQNEQLYFSKN